MRCGCLTTAGLLAVAIPLSAHSPPRERLSIDRDWRFTRGDPRGDTGVVAYVQPEFNDSGWERVNLPHDWAIAGPSASTVQARWRLPSAGAG